MYKIKINGIAAKNKMDNNITELRIKTHLNSFDFQPKDLNFKANRGSSATSKKDINIDREIIIHGLLKKTRIESTFTMEISD